MSSVATLPRAVDAPASGIRPVAQGLQPEASTPIGVTILAIYIFLITGRLLDVSPIAFMRIPLMMLILLVMMVVAKGGFQHSFASSMTKYFAAFTAWVVVCFPFSSWRAGSMPSVQWQLQAFAIYIIVVQLVRTRTDWQKVAGAYAYATLIAALLSFRMGVNIQGRVSLPGGTLADPNEFALTLVIGLPFWWFKASRATGFRKVAFLLATVPLFAAFSRAGSRSGMLALGVLFLFAFLFAQGSQKLMIAFGAGLALIAASFLLPDYLKARYLTFFSPQASNLDAKTRERLGSDIASSEERKALLIQSIQMTFHHPIVGVGPGDFSFVSWDERKATTGAGGESLVSHNTYTQVSSETGLPGFFFFSMTVVLAFRSVLADYRRLKDADLEFSRFARYLVCTCGALFVGIFFLSVGYTHMLGVIFALATSLHYIAQRSGDAVTAPAASTPPWRSSSIPPPSQLPGSRLRRPFRSRISRGRSLALSNTRRESPSH
jgi:O-antigen ligase